MWVYALGMLVYALCRALIRTLATEWISGILPQDVALAASPRPLHSPTALSWPGHRTSVNAGKPTALEFFVVDSRKASVNEEYSLFEADQTWGWQALQSWSSTLIEDFCCDIVTSVLVISYSLNGLWCALKTLHRFLCGLRRVNKWVFIPFFSIVSCPRAH